MQTYFLGLLAAATVLLGIAVAFLVAFVQIAAGRFSPAISSLALRDWQVRIWLVGLAIVFAALGAACLIVSLPPPRPPLGDLTRDQERVVVAVGGLVAVLSGLGFVIGLVGRVIGFNSAPRLAERVVKAIEDDELLGMIDEREAAEGLQNLAISAEWQCAIAAARVAPPAHNDAGEGESVLGGLVFATKTAREEASIPIDVGGGDAAPSNEEANATTRASRTYPLLPILELLNQAVRDGDRVTVAKALQAIRERWPIWLSATKDDVRRGLLVREIRDSLLESVVELIDRHGVPSLYRIYLREIGLLCRRTYEIQPSLLRTMLDHLTQTVVQLALRREDTAAAAGVEALFGLERAVAADADAAISVHQALGSVGRTVGHLLPDPLGFQFNRPGFGYLDESSSSVLYALREGYWNLADRAESTGNPADSRIWLEAAEVTISSLLDRAVETGRFAPFREHITMLMSELFRAVESLAYRGAGVCLSIGLLALKRFADVAIDADEESIWESIGFYTLRLGLIAEDRNHTGFVGKSGADEAVAIFSCVPARYRSAIVLDVYTHAPDPVHHDSVWRFVKRAGVQLGTNFGMMFDPVTGEDYAKDDLRRQ